ncbi:MAG: hypothetical protein OXU61_09760 [Gammaproteobacteria bacterium]|nr:hypothetical protein [Gammaproteobacteria bacterium]MDD9818401.1 hypothetical protein [Gammaproteobacteria bacterium]
MPDLGPGSEAIANYIAICDTIADSYPASIAHGLQKDAIQNSLDARKGRKAVVRVEFDVVKTERGEFLMFTDSNTTGLTGDVKSNTEDYENLLKDDHWARFEAFAFTKDDPDALGARGQGKFIFLRASKRYRMFYDTLRDDGVYRLGATRATKTGRPIYPKRGDRWEDKTAEEKLAEHCGLKPLTTVGARVIVCDPRPEVLDEIRGGEFAAAIQETWFRAIEKKQLEVWISTQGKSIAVELPDTHPLPSKDFNNIKTWKYRHDFNEDVVQGDFKIKNFHAAYLPDAAIPEAMQGIAILQNGMKIQALGMDIAPPDINEKITGFVEFDKPLDQELRKGNNQHPNHYQLKWRSRVPRDIKAFIQRQLQEFGRKKLNLGETRQQQQQRTRDNAERIALELLLKHASDLDLGHKRKSLSGKQPNGPIPPPPPPPHKQLGVTMQVTFPDDAKKPRVDWGDNIRVSAECFNKTAHIVTGKLAIRVLHADTQVEELTDEAINLSAGDANMSVAQINGGAEFSIALDKTRYAKPGEYRIRAVLTDSISGERVDFVTRKFWLEEEPPRRFPFDLQPAELPTKHAWQPSGDIKNPTIYYNTLHPEFKQIQDDEQDQTDYLLNICLDGALHFILTRPVDDSGKPDYHPLNTESIAGADRELAPEKVYEEISHYKAKVRWRIHEGG